MNANSHAPRHLTLLIMLTIAALLVVPSIAAAKAPQLKDINAWRTANGAWVVTGVADYTKNAHTAKGLPDARSRGILTVTLINGNHRITATDTTLLGASADRGRLVYFHIRIPAANAVALGNPKKVRVRATLGREASTANGRRLGTSTRQDPPEYNGSIIIVGGGQCMNSMTGEFTACPPAPPAPPVGFEQWVGGTGDSNWLGANQALMCLNFWGSGYAQPNWYSIGLSAANDTSVGFGFTPPASTAVSADGTFSESSYLDVLVGGYAQVTSGPTLSGSIPTSVLSGPVTSSTGNATLNVSPQVQSLPTTWSLSPLTQAEAAGVC